MPNPSLLQWSHRYYQLKKDAGIEDVQSRSTIYQLTKSMVGDENHKISVAICTCVAIVVCCRISTSRRQREVHHSFPRGDFWDQVDKTLDSIKSMPCRKDGGLSISSLFIFLQSLTLSWRIRARTSRPWIPISLRILKTCRQPWSRSKIRLGHIVHFLRAFPKPP